MTHQHIPAPSTVKTEPASMSEVIRVILVLLVGAGWLTLDSATVNAIVSVVGVILSIVLTWWTRRKVTPKVRPQTDEGRALVPAPPPTTLGNPPT